MHQPGRVGHPAHDRVLSLQQTAGNHAVVQRFREYDEVAAASVTGAGKLVNAPGLHYTVSKPNALAGHFDQFHVTYHEAVQGKHPHFYFDDAGTYLPAYEQTKQNQDWIDLKGQERFDVFKADAPKKAENLLKKAGFPAYEGPTPATVAKAHADKAEAAADAVQEAAGVRTVVAQVGKPAAKQGDVTKFADAMKELTGATSAIGSVVARNAIKVTLTYEKYTAAKAAKLKLAGHLYNTKAVTAEIATG